MSFAAFQCPVFVMIGFNLNSSFIHQDPILLRHLHSSMTLVSQLSSLCLRSVRLCYGFLIGYTVVCLCRLPGIGHTEGNFTQVSGGPNSLSLVLSLSSQSDWFYSAFFLPNIRFLCAIRAYSECT